MDPDEKHLNDAIDTLVEYFDTIQIFATRHEPNKEDGTVGFNLGRGNLYAREGQVRAWLLRHDEQARCDARKEWEKDQ